MYRSCRGPEFSPQHPHQTAQNCLLTLALERSCASGLSTRAHMQLWHTHTHTYTWLKIRRKSIILINSKNYCFWSRHNYSVHKDTWKHKFEKPSSIIRTQGKRINSQKLSSDFQTFAVIHTIALHTHTYMHTH